MKIVINNCYGGFGVSAEALKELVSRGSKAVEAMPIEKYYGADDTSSHLYRPNWKEDYEKELSRCVDASDGYLAEPWGSVIYKDDVVYSFDRDEKFRTDAELIAVVEEMGSKKASSKLAKLKVVEVPDGIQWSISEYDGIESVEEQHRSWN